MKKTPRFPARQTTPPVAIKVSPEFMIASPPQLQMSPVAMIVSPTHSVRCNYREPDMPMIASPGADDCKPLQLQSAIPLTQNFRGPGVTRDDCLNPSNSFATVR
jgi:hypothetical protein